jgi:hypothetical protein
MCFFFHLKLTLITNFRIFIKIFKWLSSMNSSQNEEIARNQQEIEKLRQEKNEEIEKLKHEKNEEIEKLKAQNKKDKLGFLQILEKL